MKTFANAIARVSPMFVIAAALVAGAAIGRW